VTGTVRTPINCCRLASIVTLPLGVVIGVAGFAGVPVVGMSAMDVGAADVSGDADMSDLQRRMP
jgi:hypothetical protein